MSVRNGNPADLPTHAPVGLERPVTAATRVKEGRIQTRQAPVVPSSHYQMISTNQTRISHIRGFAPDSGKIQATVCPTIRLARQNGL